MAELNNPFAINAWHHFADGRHVAAFVRPLIYTKSFPAFSIPLASMQHGLFGNLANDAVHQFVLLVCSCGVQLLLPVKNSCKFDFACKYILLASSGVLK